MLSSCVMNTKVLIESNVPGAQIRIGGRDYGTVPTQLSMSNAVWDDPEIILEKPGYHMLRTKAEKEIKIVNGLIGFFFFWPSLGWCYGPREYQYLFMREE